MISFRGISGNGERAKYMQETEGGGIEQKGKRTHRHGQQCDDCWGEGYKGTK